MGNLIRRFGIACIAMVVAVSLFLSPANAVAMFDCDIQQSVETVHDHAHSSHVDVVSVEQKFDSSTHLADHCVAHACAVAVEAPSVQPESLHLMKSAGFSMQSKSLVAAAKPKVLRRPPRV